MSKLYIDEIEDIELYSIYDEDQETVVPLGLLRELHPAAMLDLLEDAFNGLKWYRDAHPDDVSGADDELYARIEAALARPAEGRAPIDMVLHCPKCGMQHIDAPEFTPQYSWTNPPHRSHLCRGCDHIWRPADVPTNGVQAVKTTGSADSPITPPTPTNQARTQALQEMVAEAEKHDRSAYCELGFDEETLNRARAALAPPGA